jgi:predicted DNA-binding protein YlxM (UPF0122 family)
MTICLLLFDDYCLVFVESQSAFLSNFFADDTAVVAIASQKLQTDLLAIQDWFKKNGE